MTASAKHWTFTLNNYTVDELEFLQNLFNDELHRYIGFSKEVGESGTPHLQGYLAFVARRTLGWIRAHVNGRAHYEQAQGSPAQNRDYITKEEGESHYELFEYGTLPGGARKRTDVDGLLEDIRGRKSLRTLCDKHGKYLLRYARGVTLLRSVYGQHRKWPTQVFVYWGKTRTGKTSKAFIEMCNEKAFFYPGGGWFDQYDEDEDVIFDDFHGGEFQISYLLKLLDRYPMQVPVKGGFVNWVPKRIFITSNLDPRTWYPNAHPEHVEALFARFTEVLHFAI